jgi:hypothetical protein
LINQHHQALLQVLEKDFPHNQLHHLQLNLLVLQLDNRHLLGFLLEENNLLHYQKHLKDKYKYHHLQIHLADYYLALMHLYHLQKRLLLKNLNLNHLLQHYHHLQQ